MFNLTINSTNVANSLNNMYQYQFKNGAFEVPANAEMMITSFQIPYSWYNITSRYNNNSFKIYWPSPTVNSLTLTNGGSGYTSAPTVAFTATSTTIASATVTTGGSGYTSAPTLAFSGGGGTGATAIAVLTGAVVSSIIVTNPGTGYTSTPTIAFSGGGGTLAAATAVRGITATATAVLTGTSVASITRTGAGGSGYTTAPTVVFTGGGGSGATATPVFTATTIASIAVSAGGTGYTSAPTVVFTGGGGTLAAGTAVLTGDVVTSVTMTTNGSGYTTLPTISFTGGGGGTGAVATAVVTATTIASITVTNAGTGYTSVPVITFTGGGGGTGVTATAVLTPTSVASLTLALAGTGYQASPTISFSGGGGTGAAATANAYTPYTLNLDDGFYTVNALNARIQQFCIEKGMYLTDGSGNNVYYLSITPNSTAYANQIITKLIPISGTGYTVPSGFAGYSLKTPRPPYVEILSNNFGKYLGFTSGIYGKDVIANYNVLSNLIPTATTVNSLLVKCSLVNNGCSNQSDILDAFAIGGSSGGTFGGNLNYTNNIEKWVRISEGRYNNFIVTITDQNNNDISILDSNLLINFLIRVK